MRKFYEYMATKAQMDASYHYAMTAAHFTGFGMCGLLAVLTYSAGIYPLTIIIGCISPFFLIGGIWNWIKGSVNEEDARVYRAMGGNPWKTFWN